MRQLELSRSQKASRLMHIWMPERAARLQWIRARTKPQGRAITITKACTGMHRTLFTPCSPSLVSGEHHNCRTLSRKRPRPRAVHSLLSSDLATPCLSFPTPSCSDPLLWGPRQPPCWCPGLTKVPVAGSSGAVEGGGRTLAGHRPPGPWGVLGATARSRSGCLQRAASKCNHPSAPCLLRAPVSPAHGARLCQQLLLLQKKNDKIK